MLSTRVVALLSLLVALVSASPILTVRQSSSVDCRTSSDPVAQGQALCPEGGDIQTLIANAVAAAALQNTGDTCQRDRQKICVFTCRRAVVLQNPGRFGETPDAFQTRIDTNAGRVASRCSGNAAAPAPAAPAAPAPAPAAPADSPEDEEESQEETTAPEAASGNVDCRTSADPVAQGRALCPEGGDLATLTANAIAAAELQDTDDTCQRDRQKICVFSCRRAVVLQNPGRFGETPEAFQTRIDANAARVRERC